LTTLARTGKGHKRTFQDILGISRTIPPVPEVQTLNRRLDSWKEIAAYFDRDERTVKRWEKERSLPVHRLPGGSRARVFAYTDELSQWMKSPVAEPPPTETEAAIPLSLTSSEDLGTPPEFASTHRGKRWIALAAAAVLGLIVLMIVYRGADVSKPVGGTPHSHGSGELHATVKPSIRPANPEAQELYLKGLYYWDKRTPDDLNKAVDFFTQAIVHDPNYAPAYVGLANCYNLLREFAAMPPNEAFPRALAAARKAVELDDSSAEAHTAVAFVTFNWNWDAAGAEREFLRAIELNPDYVTAHHWYATFLMALARFPEALDQIERAQQLDPGSTSILTDKAFILFYKGDKDQATSLLKQIEASQPQFFSTHQYLAYIYEADGDYPDFLEESRESAVLSHNEQSLTILQEGEKGFQSGGRQEMYRRILQAQKKFFNEGAIYAYWLAATEAKLGNKAEALTYLQDSHQRHEPEFLSIRICPCFWSLHDDPVFRKLVANAGLPTLP
jgi:tetratricopeptide (TPR) repeat protein